MTGDFAERMQQRMVLIEKLAALNSNQLKNTQARSGIEVELTACIEEIEQAGESEATKTQRTELEARYKATTAACIDCDQELDRLTDELNTLDQAGQAGPAS